MQYRKDPLISGECYHIFSRSIAKYIIFNNDYDYNRMVEMINLFSYTDFYYKYTRFKELISSSQKNIINDLQATSPRSIEIIAYCLMPTHIHLIIKQTTDHGISNYLGRVLNSYSRYFNLLHQRSGPLWESRFKGVRIENDDQLLHTTRYVHLNPVSAGIVKDPEDWNFSSYKEYIVADTQGICNLDTLPDFSSDKYKQFTNDQKSYQRDLQIIKNLTIDN